MKPELDIVDELRFFAEAADSKAVVVTMLSGRTFLDAADEIERLRSLITEWVDAEDLDGHPSDYHQSLTEAEDALRKAVGR